MKMKLSKATTRRLVATHVDAVRAVLDMISKYYSRKIVIGEELAVSNLMTGLKTFTWIFKKYDVGVADL